MKKTKTVVNITYTIRGVSMQYNIPYGALYSQVVKAKDIGMTDIRCDTNYSERRVFSKEQENSIQDY